MVDASVAVQWVVPEASTPLSDTMLDGFELVAPELLFVEVANVFRKKLAGGLIDVGQGRDGLAFIADHVEVRPMTRDMVIRSFDLAHQLSHPVYDCVYLALTETIGARFATHDLELRRRVTRSGHEDWLFEFPGGPS